jgi:septal ring factor EnvC (AmiA/AmiB activator)
VSFYALYLAAPQELTHEDEFQASSKELEDELEKELAATEKQQAELKERIKRLEEEKEDWKVS